IGRRPIQLNWKRKLHPYRPAVLDTRLPLRGCFEHPDCLLAGAMSYISQQINIGQRPIFFHDKLKEYHSFDLSLLSSFRILKIFPYKFIKGLDSPYWHWGDFNRRKQSGVRRLTSGRTLL